jgi:hypothetical protein
MSWRITVGDAEAGPIVQMIFVLCAGVLMVILHVA